MKKLLLAILCLPLIGFGQKTYVPDDAFEQVLINLDLDDIFDDSVYTAAIDTVPILYISNEGIADLTGIEDFLALTDLFCHSNQLQSLDLSNNPNLFEVNCSYNQLTSLSLKNGNPFGLWYVMAFGNPNLLCVEVDNVVYANYYWQIDPTAVFSTNCNSAIYGCTDPTALNYNLAATVDDGSCIYAYGCTDPAACNYDALATVDDGSCLTVYGCMNSAATNYNALANCPDTCIFPQVTYGCVDSTALNYNPTATIDDGSCIYSIDGCTDPTALNYNPTATVDDGSCIYTTGISDIANNTRKLIKIVDMLGRETIIKNNEPLFYIYNDGTVEKKVVIE